MAIAKNAKPTPLVLVNNFGEGSIRYARYEKRESPHVIDATEPLVASDVEFFRTKPEKFYEAVGIVRGLTSSPTNRRFTMISASLSKTTTEALREAYPITYPLRLKKQAEELGSALNIDPQQIVDAGLSAAQINAASAQSAVAAVSMAELPLRIVEDFKSGFDIHAAIGDAVERVSRIALLPLEVLRTYQMTFKEVFRIL